MQPSKSFAAQLLLTSSQTLAGYAAALLSDKYPETLAKFGEDAFGAWKDSYVHQIHELAAALDMDRPELFLAHIQWTREAYEHRGVPVVDLQHSLEVLRIVILEQMPEHLHECSFEILDQALGDLDNAVSKNNKTAPTTPDLLLSMKYVEALLMGNRQDAIALIMDRVKEDDAVTDVVLNVLVPAQQELGRMWHAGDIGVAEEHFTTGVTQSLISILAQQVKCAEPNKKTAILSATQGNTHDMGLRVLDLFLQEAGWRTIFLGADTPPHEVSEGIKVFGADVLVLSAALPTQLRILRSMIASIRESNPTLKVLVGGRVFIDDPELGLEIGADGCTIDPRGAVALAADLVGISKPAN